MISGGILGTLTEDKQLGEVELSMENQLKLCEYIICSNSVNVYLKYVDRELNYVPCVVIIFNEH